MTQLDNFREDVRNQESEIHGLFEDARELSSLADRLIAKTVYSRRIGLRTATDD